MIYNNCNINSLLLHRKVRLIIPNTTLAAPAAFAHCLLDFIVLSIITPKSLSSSTSEPQKLWVVQKWHGHFLLPCQVWWASCVARRLQTKKGDFFVFLPVLHFLSGSKWVYSHAWGDTFLPYTWNVARREPTVRSPLPNFTLIAAEIWEYSPQHCQKFGNLPTNVPLRGDFLHNFYEILSVCTHLYVAVVAFGDKQPTYKHFPRWGHFLTHIQ